MTTITIDRAVVEQALEALEHDGLLKKRQVITALRTALAQEQAEPRNQCGETCERAKLCAVCAKELSHE